MPLERLHRVEAFRGRAEAGRELAQRRERYRGGDAIVLGLARGGVPVAFEVAVALGCSGSPGESEEVERRERAYRGRRPPPETCEALRPEADEVICARTPELFYAVGTLYEAFPQTSKEEVRRLLEWAWDGGRG